jgi:glycosyltransferase involved in cell wall biosynthesis
MERVMSELANYFASKEELELHLVLYDLTREIFYPVPPSVEIHKPQFSFKNRFRLLNTLKTALFLRRTIKRIKPDSVLSFGEYWNTLVLISLTGMAFPVFISDRCSPEKEFGFFHRSLRALFYPKARGIIAQTQKARDIYLRQFRHSDIRVIGNPIREIAAVAHDQRENIVLMVGRLIKTKHQDKLIEMFIEINNPEWKLILVGYDHLKQNISGLLRDIIRSGHSEDRVLLAGRQTDVDSYYRRSKIFAFTSSSEGFPNAIGEALSAGIPAIAFDCVAGPSEMITDGRNGYLIPLFDYERFREKLELLMNDKNLRTEMGFKASEDIKEFAIDRIGEKYLSFILGKSQEERIN